MIHTFIDESGTHAASPLMVFTGSLFKQDKLACFEIDWIVHNLSVNISHVHTVDMEPGSGEFKDRKRWPHHERLVASIRVMLPAHSLPTLLTAV
jgi:hypothetical protein